MNWAITSNKGTCNSASGGTFNIFRLSSQTPGAQEILVRVNPADTSDIGCVGRYNNTNQFYYGVLTGGNTLAIGKDNSGFSTLASASFSYSAGTAYWLRFNLTGTTLKLKGWADGSSEPGTWNVTTTDSAFSTGGFGLGSDSSSGTNTQFDSLTVTDGITTSTRTVTATAALLQTSTRTVTVTAALLQTSTRTIPATTALLQTSARTVPCTAALELTSTRTISATAALELTSTRTVPTTASLALSSIRTVPTSAALEQTGTRIVPTSAALEQTSTRTIPCTAALSKERTIPATVALLQTGVRTIPCTVSLGGVPPPTNAIFYVRSGNANFYVRGD